MPGSFNGLNLVPKEPFQCFRIIQIAWLLLGWLGYLRHSAIIFNNRTSAFRTGVIVSKIGKNTKFELITADPDLLSHSLYQLIIFWFPFFIILCYDGDFPVINCLLR